MPERVSENYTNEQGCDMIKKYLEDLENRIDPHVEDVLFSRWRAFWDGNLQEDIFIPRREKKIPASVNWPEIPVNSAIEDYELMALQQFKMCSDMIAEGGGGMLGVRCNYGTGILPSVFGAELFMMDKKLNTLPTTSPIGSGSEGIIKILNNGTPPVRSGLGVKVFEMAEMFIKLMGDYPKIKKYVNIYHPDLQGPMDICELLWGSGLFISLIDEFDLVHRFLNLITETYSRFMNEWTELVPLDDGYSTHWSMFHKGNIMLRNDSAMNLSPEMFEEFIKPYDSELLNRFNGGCMHFCGRGDHYIGQAASIEKLYAVNMTQPELNDMNKILDNTVDKGIKIIGFGRETAENLIKSGRDLKKNVHCY